MLDRLADSRSVTDGKVAILSHLESLSPLSDHDRELFSTTLGAYSNWQADHELIAADAALADPLFVVSGWVCRVVNLPDGRRQILDFYIPGDLAGFTSQSGGRAKASFLCLSNVITVSARELVRRVRQEPSRYSALATALSPIE